MTRALLTLLTGIVCFSATAQISFTNESFLLNDAGLSSGVAMGVADMNGDGLDDIVRLQNASDLIIEFQVAGGGQFTKFVQGNAGPGREWGMCIADVNEDGYNDVLVGGVYNHLKVFVMKGSAVDSVYWMPNPDVFLQAANFADIDNDGLVDLFACHDDGLAPAFRNLGNDNWMHDPTLINTASPSPSDNSGNYGSVWTDYDSDGDLDLYISKCRGGVTNIFDGRRTNLLFENDGSNNYSREVADSVGLRPFAQSWAADFADIDNDGDLDAFIVNHDSISKFYENVNNMFIDFTVESGVYTELDEWYSGIQSVFDDYDNDGFVDLIITGVSGHYMFHNNGDRTFTAVDAFPAGSPDIHSLGVGDLNADGFLDILAGFANGFNTPSTEPDRIFTNDGNSNNWLKVQLNGTSSNINGIGARLELYGSWGKQIREVRGGEGYGIVTSLETHFGIGATTVIDSLIVLWPSGVRDVICNPNHNTVLEILEGCQPECRGIALDLMAVICTGESYSFGGNILTEPGMYSEMYVTAGGCDSTVYLDLIVDGVDNSVTQTGLTLTAAPSLSYQWIDCVNGNSPITGANNQSFTPTVNGTYAVLVSNENCSDTSECINVVVSATLNDIFPFTVDVFPNPTSGNLNIAFGRQVEEAVISIQSVHGAMLYKEVIVGLEELQLNISQFPVGNYFLEIQYEGNSGVMQLLKQ